MKASLDGPSTLVSYQFNESGALPGSSSPSLLLGNKNHLGLEFLQQPSSGTEGAAVVVAGG